MAPRTNYALAFKTKVVEYALAIGNWTQAGLEHGVDEACVRRWIKLLNRSSEATLNNPIIARRRRVPRSTARTTRVPRSTVRSPRARAMYPAIDTQVLEFINRKRSEDGFKFTRAKICAEAKRISSVNGITDFKASLGWYQKFMRRNGFTTKQLNRRVPIDNQPRTPAENQDQAGLDHVQVEANQPQGVPEAFEPDVQQTPSSENSLGHGEDEANQPPGVSEAFEPDVQQTPSPENSPGHGQSPDDSENFHDKALKTSDMLDQLLQIEFSPVATESVGSNIPTTADGPDTIPLHGNLFSWHLSEVNSNEEVNEKVNEEVNEESNEELIDLLTKDFEQLENMDYSFDFPQLESDVVSPHSSPWRPGYQANILDSLSFG